MGRCSVIPVSGDLIGEVASCLKPNEKDYSENLVVFPGKRPGHFLRKLLAKQVGSPYMPPAILSMEEFVDSLYAVLRDPIPRKLEAIDAIAFLFDLHRGMQEPLGRDEFLSLDAFLPLGLTIYRDLEELVIEDVSPYNVAHIETFVETPIPALADRSLQSLSFFYDGFYRAVSQSGFSSRSQRYRIASTEITRGIASWTRIVFAGFFGLTACERRLFKEILAWDNTFFLFQDGPGIRERIAFFGIDHEERTAHGAEQHKDIHFYGSPDTHGQIFVLSSLLKDRLQGNGHARNDEDNRMWNSEPNDAVIVLPTPETLFAVLHHALPVVPDGDYNISLGYPLERTPTWGFLGSLMQLSNSMDGERLYVPDYLDFVLHPYTKNIYLDGRSETTRVMFHAIEEILLEERTRNFVSLEEIEENADLFGLLSNRVAGLDSIPTKKSMADHLKTIHSKLIRKIVSFKDIGNFAESVMDILVYIYDNSSARLHPFFHPFAESFLEQLDLLKKSRVRHLAFKDKSGYFHFLRSYITRCFTPFEGTPLHGLQVLGFLETRNLRFDSVYILDANEGVIPDTKKDESLISLKVRYSLGLPTYRDRDMLAAYYFDVLVRGAGEVHVLFVENGKKERSRFVEKLLWEKQKRENIESSDKYVNTLSYRLSLEGTIGEPIRKTTPVLEYLRSRPFDATSLDTYLRCPLQFYYHYVLRISKKGDPRTEVDKADVGKLVHKILLKYFKKRCGVTLSEADIDLSEMRAFATSTFEEFFGAEPVGAAYLLKEQVAKQMETYLFRYELPIVSTGPVTVLHLERMIQCRIDQFRFKGILDRIDVRNGKTLIIDYKTGSPSKRLAVDFDVLDPNDRNTWHRAVGSLQLPFYLMLWEASERQMVPDVEALFLLLGRTSIDRGIEMPFFGKRHDYLSSYRNARSVVLQLAEEITDPRVPFDPSLRKRDACDLCDFVSLCGAAS